MKIGGCAVCDIVKANDMLYVGLGEQVSVATEEGQVAGLLPVVTLM